MNTQEAIIYHGLQKIEMICMLCQLLASQLVMKRAKPGAQGRLRGLDVGKI